MPVTTTLAAHYFLVDGNGILDNVYKKQNIIVDIVNHNKEKTHNRCESIS